MPTKDDHREQAGLGFPVVGIGASAGGLEACKEFFAAVPADSGMAFVLVQHLDPDHESLMADLLSKCTRMPVSQAEDGVRVEPDRVYVIPPNHSMTLRDGRLRLGEPDARRGTRMSVDTFLRSLAQDQGELAVGVILSGTGSDGTAGLDSIRSHGGLTLAQEPGSAAHGGMPASAISAGVVDLVRKAGEIPRAIVHTLENPRQLRARAGAVAAGSSDTDPAEPDLLALMTLILARRGIDFRHYKRATLLRRIERRLRLNHLDTIREYVEQLRRDPDELQALSMDLLIGVTAFFRDADAFEALEHEVIAPLIRRADGQEPIRIWVPGCATGEEAYSIAMLFREQLERQAKTVPVQIFASDIDAAALDKARQGVYPLASAADLTPERLERHFESPGADGEQLRVRPALREMIVFARHNLIGDPPYSKVDLVTCRNLLIYLRQPMQERLVALFHFALRPGGFLMLGGSEGLGRHTDLFSQVADKRVRIFARREAIIDPREGYLYLAPLAYGGTARAGGEDQMALRKPRLADMALRWVVEAFAPAVVIVDRRLGIRFQCGPVGEFLDHPFGEPTTSLVDLVRDGLKTRLRGALQRAVERGERVDELRARMRIDGRYRAVRIRVRPLGDAPGAGDSLFMVSFESAQAPAESVAPTGQAEDAGLVRQLEEELSATKEDLQSTVEEMETSNEELKASNEEIMSINEELQSANEELQTSKEELQSLNEELTTLNSQLHDKIQELEDAGNDISNLLLSSDVATLFLDTGLRIKRYTPAVSRLFHLRDSDVGRPLDELSFTIHDPELLAHARQVLSTLVPVEVEVVDQGGRWFIRRVLPYRTGDDRIGGVVITYSDVTRIRQSERVASERLAQLEAVYRHTPVGLGFLDTELRYRQVNETLAACNGLSIEDHLGRTPAQLLPAELGEEIEARLRRVLVGGQPMIGDRVQGRTHGSEGVTRDWEVSYYPLAASDGGALGVTVVVQDVSAERQVEICAAVETAVAAALAPHRSESELFARVLDALEEGLDLAGSAVWDRAGDVLTLRDQRVRRPDRLTFDAPLRGLAEHLASEALDAQEPLVSDAPADAGFVPGGAVFVRIDGAEDRVSVAGLFFAERREISETVRACIRRAAQRLGDYLGYAAAYAERESAARDFRALAENMPDIVTRFDREGRHRYVNPAVQAATGIPPERFIGRTNREMGMPEKQVRQWDERIRTVFEEAREVFEEFSFETPVGERHFQWRLVPEFGVDGTVRHALGVTTDVTDLKVAQQMLLEREAGIRQAMAELDAVYQSAPAAFCVIDREYRLSRVNERLARTLRRSPDALVGCPIGDFRDALPNGLERLLHAAFQHGRAVIDERLAGAAGEAATWRCWSVSVQPLAATDSDASAVSAISCMFEDITRRVLTEKRLAARAAVARVLAVAADSDSLPDRLAESFAVVCDCERIEHWWFPQGAERPEEIRLLVGETAGGERPDTRHAVRESVLSRKARWLRDDAGERIAAGFVLPLGGIGGSAGALCTRMRERIAFDPEFLQTMDDIASDLGEWQRRRRAEQDVQDARRLAEEANAAKSEFLANISHELRSPLTAILGYAELLEREMEDGRPRRHVSTVRRNGEHLLLLLNDLLDLAKLEAGKVTVEPVLTEPDRLIGEVRSLMNVRAAEKGLDLAVEFDGLVPRTIVTDPLRLRQILINLVGNAIKFTERGGVTIRTVFLDSEEPRLRVDITDTGVGLSLEQQESLFSAFTQVDAASTCRFGGTGLGLAISRRLAQLLGGDIELVSRKGHGSTFTVTVLAGRAAEVSRTEGRAFFEQAAEPVGSNDDRIEGHVLVVDDNDDLRELVRGYLEAAGAIVTTARGAVEAERLVEAALAPDFRGAAVDAVILDMQMPDVDGFELARCIRAMGFERPVIALTAGAMMGERERCLAAGCSEYVSKPIDSGRLIGLLVGLMPQAGSTETGSSGKAIAVLIVEDNDDAREMTALMLESAGLSVREASDGRSALAAVREAPPDVVLLDISLPDINGNEVASRIRADPAAAATRIVAMSGYTADRLDLADFDRHVLKPASGADLLRVIAEVAEGGAD